MCAMSFLLLFLALALQDINEPAIWASGMFTSLLLFETVALIGWFVVWRHLEKKKYGIPMSKRVKVEEEEDDLEAEKVNNELLLYKRSHPKKPIIIRRS